MKRDMVILATGVLGLGATAIAAFTLDLSKNIPIILALIAAFGGLLGLPRQIRKDEQERDK